MPSIDQFYPERAKGVEVDAYQDDILALLLGSVEGVKEELSACSLLKYDEISREMGKIDYICLFTFKSTNSRSKLVPIEWLDISLQLLDLSTLHSEPTDIKTIALISSITKELPMYMSILPREPFVFYQILHGNLYSLLVQEDGMDAGFAFLHYKTVNVIEFEWSFVPGVELSKVLQMLELLQLALAIKHLYMEVLFQERMIKNRLQAVDKCLMASAEAEGYHQGVIHQRKYPQRIDSSATLGWHSEEEHVTWAHLEKKQTRLRHYTKNHEELQTIDQSTGGKLCDRNAKEAWALLEDLALYGNKSWNDPRDFAKSVKAISLPQDVSSTFDCRLIELENQVQRLMEAHLAPT
ncbi:hypothetical protein Tco_0871364 [Tanacetum coccineum]